MQPLGIRWRFSGAVFLNIKWALVYITHESIVSALLEVSDGGRLSTWITSYLQSKLVCVLTKNGDTTLYKISKVCLRVGY